MRVGKVVGGRFSRGGTLLDDGRMDGWTGAGSMGLYLGGECKKVGFSAVLLHMMMCLGLEVAL